GGLVRMLVIRHQSLGESRGGKAKGNGSTGLGGLPGGSLAQQTLRPPGSGSNKYLRNPYVAERICEGSCFDTAWVALGALDGGIYVTYVSPHAAHRGASHPRGARRLTGGARGAGRGGDEFGGPLGARRTRHPRVGRAAPAAAPRGRAA